MMDSHFRLPAGDRRHYVDEADVAVDGADAVISTSKQSSPNILSRSGGIFARLMKLGARCRVMPNR